LGEIKDQRAVEPLIAAMKETHPAVRGAVGNALCELDSPRTIELLKTALNSADADSRRNMVETLSSCGKPDFEDLLIETLNRFNEKNLAQVFINSKHPKLEDAARKWAASYGYQIFCDGCIDTDK